MLNEVFGVQRLLGAAAPPAATRSVVGRLLASRGRTKGGMALVLAGLCALAPAGWAQSGGGDDAKGLRQQSSQLYQQGKYDEAAHAAERALAVDEKLLGANHVDTAASLQALATAYRGMGAYAKALPLAERALAIREKARGVEDLDTAASLHSLAEVYRGLGEYAQALPRAQQALAVREKLLGSDHPVTAESLNDLGGLYLDMGDDQQAAQLVEQALKVREKKLQPEDPDVAESLNNLAVVYWHQRRYAEALQRFQSALNVKDRVYGPDHPLLGTAHANLAALYLAMRADAKTDAERQDLESQALQHALRAKAILAQSDPRSERPDTAKSFINLGWSLWAMAPVTNDQVRDLFARALAIREKALGVEHPDTAQSLVLLATFDQRIGDYPQALALFQRALAAEDRTLGNVFAVVSEEQKLRYVESTEGHYLAALSLIHRHFASDAGAVRLGLDLVLRRKGIVLDAQSRTQEAIAKHLEGPALQSWRRLTQYRGELSKLLLGAPEGQAPAEYKRAIEKLQAAIKQEEESLGQRSGLVAQELAQRAVTAQALAGRLPENSILVEFVRIQDWDEQNLAWSKASRYLAFVLTRDNQVTLVDLGDAGAIDAGVTAALAAIKDPQAFDDLGRYARKTDSVLADLYRRLFQPLEATIGSSRRLIVSPDGELNKAPFAALKTPDGRYLIEHHMLSSVSSGRDLLRDKSAIAPTLRLLLVANPAFDDKEVLGRGNRRERALRPAGLRGSFGALPGTAQEAEAIRPLLKGTTKVLLGKDATETAVRETKAPQVLHLATHGFFLPDADEPAPDPLGRPRRGRSRGDSDSPMAHSAMALAGANYFYTVAQGDDGILTAMEVSGMDLYGTDLVVLSACETALGDVKIGEGVYGLRRAFVLAGARNLVMSLWPVDDEVTRDLMERFYRAYGAGESVATALHKAQLETIASLRSTNKDGQSGEPVAPVTLWAPFIVQQTGE